MPAVDTVFQLEDVSAIAASSEFAMETDGRSLAFGDTTPADALRMLDASRVPELHPVHVPVTIKLPLMTTGRLKVFAVAVSDSCGYHREACRCNRVFRWQRANIGYL